MTDWQILVLERKSELISSLESDCEQPCLRFRGTSSPIEACEILEHRQMHAIVVDLDAPELRGLRILEHVRKTYPCVLAVAVSQHNAPDFLLEATPDLIDYAVAKPIDPMQLGRLLHDDLTEELPQRRAERDRCRPREPQPEPESRG